MNSCLIPTPLKPQYWRCHLVGACNGNTQIDSHRIRCALRPALFDLVLGARQYKQEFASDSNTSAKCRITMGASSSPSVLDIIVEDNWPHNSRRYVLSTRNSNSLCELVYGTEATGQSHTLNGLVLDITMGSYSYVYVRKTIGSNTYTVTDES